MQANAVRNMFVASDNDYQHSDDDYEMTRNDNIYDDISFDYGGRKSDYTTILFGSVIFSMFSFLSCPLY